MRANFHHQLDQLRADLGGMCALAGSAVDRATRGPLDVDADAACEVAVDIDRLRLLHNAVQRNGSAISDRYAV